jgi:stearoyl-CoA desaturase (delta-9 desaturase)
MLSPGRDNEVVLEPGEAGAANLPWTLPGWLQVLGPWLGAVAGLCWLGIADVGLTEIGLLLGMVTVSGLGVTIGYHRFFTHQAFQAKPWLLIVLGVCGATAVQGRILFWAATHRTHHQHADSAGDPHSPHHPAGGWRGFWHAHAGWLLAHHHPIDVHQVRDLLAQPLIVWLDRYYLVWVGLGLLAPGLVGAACQGSWTGFLNGVLWGGFIRIVLQQNGTFLVNSLSHAAGSRRFRTPDDSRNNWLVAWVTFGEWHNNHHAFPSSARQGLSWWELDSSYVVIRALAAAGWAWGVREPSAAALRAKRI